MLWWCDKVYYSILQEKKMYYGRRTEEDGQLPPSRALGPHKRSLFSREFHLCWQMRFVSDEVAICALLFCLYYDCYVFRITRSWKSWRLSSFFVKGNDWCLFCFFSEARESDADAWHGQSICGSSPGNFLLEESFGYSQLTVSAELLDAKYHGTCIGDASANFGTRRLSGESFLLEYLLMLGNVCSLQAGVEVFQPFRLVYYLLIVILLTMFTGFTSRGCTSISVLR